MTAPPLRWLERGVATALRIAQARATRWVFGLGAAALATWAVVSQRAAVSQAMSEMSVGAIAVSAAFTGATLVCSGMLWRTVMADLGSPLPVAAGARIFFVGQIGKYLPGSLWPAVMQAELGSAHGVPRRRTATATMVTMLVALASAFATALVTAPFVPGGLESGLGWAALLVVPLVVLLHPPVLERVVDAVLRAAGRPPLGQRTSLRGTFLATLWAVAAWVFAGLQVLALAAPLGMTVSAGSAVRLVGGYALAWAIGFLVVVAPAGAGAREVALAAVLAGSLDSGAVVVVVLLSRVLLTLADLVAAGLGLLAGRERLGTRRVREDGSSDGP